MNAQSISYTADGTTAVFAFPFPVFEPLEIEVLINGTVQVSGFTLLGKGSDESAAIQFATAPASGAAIVLRRAGHVQVSGTDAPGFLDVKLVAGANASITATSDAAGEHLVIAADANPADFLAKARNLADLTNPATARSNLGLGSAATKDVGTNAGQLVQLDAGAKLPAVDGSQLLNIPMGKVQTDGTDTPDYLQAKLAAGANVSVTKSAGKMVIAAPNALDKTANLADLTNAATARSNLGLAAVAASGAYADLSGKPALGSAAALNVDTDGTLAANSDALLASEKAVKTYVDGKVAGVLSSTTFASLEQDVAQTYLLGAMAGGWSAGKLASGGYDAFNTDTIGANSSGQSYDVVNKLYKNKVKSDMLSSASQWVGAGFTFSGASIYCGSTINGSVYSANSISGDFDFAVTPTSALVFGFFDSSKLGTYNIYGYDGEESTVSGNNEFTINLYRGYIEYNNGAGEGNLTPVSGNGSNIFKFSRRSSVVTVYKDGVLIYTYAQTFSGDVTLFIGQSANIPNQYGQNISWTTFATSPTMTLVSSPLSPAPASAPAQVKTLVLWQDLSGSAALNTDLTLEATRDGSSWSAGSLADTGYTANGFKVLWAVADVSAQPSGTSVKYRVKALNGKTQQVKGVALLVK